MPTPFVAAVVLGVVLLVATNLLVWWRKSVAVPAVCGLCAIIAVGPCLFGLVCYPLLLQTLALAVGLVLLAVPRHGRAGYYVASVVLTAGIWLDFTWTLNRKIRQYDEWRQSVPFESLEERLPLPSRRGELAEGEIWDRLESESRSAIGGRTWAFQIVHSDRVTLFHRTMGFGSGRMMYFDPKAKHFEPDLTPPVPQPERYDPNAVSLGEEVPDAARKPFPDLHANSLIDFSYPDGFGYVKGRNAVAGFRPHRFSTLPEPVERWEVRRLELVGLLLNPTAKVYVSENLPRMEEVKRLPTREPDGFEADGLTAIRAGGDLFSRGDDRVARMVGAIRSVSQCVECHGGQRGDLLGAFTYHLRRDAR